MSATVQRFNKITAARKQTCDKHDITVVHNTRSNNNNKWQRYSYLLIIVTLAVIVSVMHRNHLFLLFENDRHFSHLSNLQREISFPTEMGLYYSYYKTVVESSSFIEGLNKLTADNITEFPSTINTLYRFNVYPELVLGAAYRVFRVVTSSLGISVRHCRHVTSEGAGPDAVLSCVGVGEPVYFYLELVFAWNGLSLGILFLLATYLRWRKSHNHTLVGMTFSPQTVISLWHRTVRTINRSLLGGSLTVLAFVYNHNECTRVQWTPPLRESFSVPFYFLQVLLLTNTLRCKKPSLTHSCLLAVPTAACILTWQFGQFVLLTQFLSIFTVYSLQFINKQHLNIITTAHLVGLIASCVLLFGNKLLMTSFYSSSLAAVYITVNLTIVESTLKRMKNLFVRLCVQCCLLSLLISLLKLTTSKLLNTTDDTHIIDLLRSKFTVFRTFHTMLYTCSPEFDFTDAKSYLRLCSTLLLPTTLLVFVVTLIQLVRNQLRTTANRNSDKQQLVNEPQRNSNVDHCNNGVYPNRHKVSDGHAVWNGPNVYSSAGQVGRSNVNLSLTDNVNCLITTSKEHAEVMYHSVQLVWLCLMTCLVMRLKVFSTPHMCLITSLLASAPFFGWVGSAGRQNAMVIVVIATMSFQGIANVQYERTVTRQHSYGQQETLGNKDQHRYQHKVPEQQEALINWINNNTHPDAVFAGAMPTMATIKLSTSRPIVNHPHYEDSALRARTLLVYSLYSRQSVSQVATNLRQLRVNYVVLEHYWCFNEPNNAACRLTELWNIEEPQNSSHPSTCSTLFTARNLEPYFTRVFSNTAYQLLQVNDRDDFNDFT